VVAVGAAELIESLGPLAIDDIPVGHYVTLLEFNLLGDKCNCRISAPSLREYEIRHRAKK
jgi:hypothetical protein